MKINRQLFVDSWKRLELSFHQVAKSVWVGSDRAFGNAITQQVNLLNSGDALVFIERDAPSFSSLMKTKQVSVMGSFVRNTDGNIVNVGKSAIELFGVDDVINYSLENKGLRLSHRKVPF